MSDPNLPLQPLSRRIYGIETEFGVACTTSNGIRRLGPDEVARYLFRTVVAWGKSSNVFLRNGSRVYLDVGSHPEYATGECDDLLDLVAHDRAGTSIIHDLALQAGQRLTEEGVKGDIYLFKNNTDSHGNTYGCHENYLLSRRGHFRTIAEAMMAFLVSRQLTSGAGKVVPGGKYVISQRAEHMWTAIGSATTRTRPMINTRDEPHADPSRYRRLHVIVGDSNMSEVSTLLKVGSTELVLRVLEHQVAMRDLTLENPSRAIHDISQDPTGRARVLLASGRSITGLELQEEFYSAAQRLIEASGDPGPVLSRVIQTWRRVLDALTSGDLSRIDTEVDWVIKDKLLRRYAAKHDLAASDPKLLQLDLAYHDIHPARGLFHLLEGRGQAVRLTTEEQVLAAKRTPPQTTRAKLRGDFIAATDAAGVGNVVDWVSLKIRDEPPRPWAEPPRPGVQHTPVLCQDPFAATDERVDRILASLRDGGPVTTWHDPDSPRTL